MSGTLDVLIIVLSVMLVMIPFVGIYHDTHPPQPACRHWHMTIRSILDNETPVALWCRKCGDIQVPQV